MSDGALNPKLWADAGGITGLVIFALFFVLWAFAKTLEKILDNHRDDISKLTSLHAEERKEWWLIVDERQKETNQTNRELASAFHHMASRHRREDHRENEHQH